MVRGEIDEETNDLKTLQFLARHVEAYVGCIETKGKAQMGHREAKKKLDNARRLRGISVLNLMMKNSDTSSTMLVENWKFRCQPSVPL